MKKDQKISIDTHTWDKSKEAMVGCGYELQPDRINSEMVIHTTNGPRGQSWAEIIKYLYTTCRASIHYLIPNFVNDDGVMPIIRFLDPGVYKAWHCGFVLPQYKGIQDRAIGIELWWDEGMAKDGSLVEQQKSGLYTLCRQLIHDHQHMKRYGVYAHRWIVDPKKEFRNDPVTFCDSDLRDFIKSLWDD
jgi:N-acetyl-anhydromuramyl-L-alanine amidase AmpD